MKEVCLMAAEAYKIRKRQSRNRGTYLLRRTKKWMNAGRPTHVAIGIGHVAPHILCLVHCMGRDIPLASHALENF